MHDPRIKALQQGRASTRRVHSVYYDTPERDLLRAGLALRLRSDGARWLQTLKTGGQAAAGLHLREEWEWPPETCSNRRLWPLVRIRDSTSGVVPVRTDRTKE